jgi:integrase
MLLNGTRRGEPAAMRYSQIDADNLWALPGEFTKNHLPLFLPLSGETLTVVAAQPRLDGQDLVFSVNGKDPFNNWSKSKERFDRRVLRRLRAQARAEGRDPAKVKPLPNWTLHDLRRTAKSLMSRAKVRPEHSERVLNHMITGVEGTYDRYSYVDEKRDALERLARLLRQVIDGEPAKIIRLPVRGAAG